MTEAAISSTDLVIIGAYTLMMLGIGYVVYRRAPSFEEYSWPGAP